MAPAAGYGNGELGVVGSSTAGSAGWAAGSTAGTSGSGSVCSVDPDNVCGMFERIELSASYLRGVWSSDGRTVWVVGDDGVLAHWDGSAWSEPVDVDGDLKGIWGAGPDDIWAVGSDVLHFDGQDWSEVEDQAFLGLRADAVWGNGPNDVWVVGNTGFNQSGITSASLVHWNGVSWATSSVTTGPIRGVWAATADDAWVATGHTGLYHWDGTDWSRRTELDTELEDAGVSDSWSVLGVHGSDANNVWVVGEPGGRDVGGFAAQWNGNTWSTTETETSVELAGVWTSSANDVWAVGQQGTAIHWNGCQWSSCVVVAEYPGPGPYDLLSVWANGDGDVWIVGAQGTVLRGRT